MTVTTVPTPNFLKNLSKSGNSLNSFVAGVNGAATTSFDNVQHLGVFPDPSTGAPRDAWYDPNTDTLNISAIFA